MAFQFGFFDAPKEAEEKIIVPKIPTEIVKLTLEMVYPQSAANSVVQITADRQLKRRKFDKKETLLQEIANEELRSVVTDVDVRDSLYEGGFKMWECTIDLCQFLLQNFSNNLIGKRVLELGCGHGLPGILTLQLGCDHCAFQDLNADVLRIMTACNLGLNEVPSESTTLLAGDWSSPDLLKALIPDTSDHYHLILAAETIYREDSYDAFVKLIENCLHPDGMALIAAKRYYFGVGGGVQLFSTFLEKNSRLKCEIAASFEDGKSNTRDILALQFSNR